MHIDRPREHHTEQLWELWQEAFGDPRSFWEGFRRTAFSPDRCRCVLADDRVIAAAYWFSCEYRGRRIAYLYAVATQKQWQGKGICRSLLTHIHRELESAGFAGAILVPGNEGLFRLYEKLGYRTCSHVSLSEVFAAQVPCSLRPVDPAEYAAIRRTLLPPDAVVQESENLTFLAAQAKLYAGEDFLLAAAPGETELWVPELLPDGSRAPEILRALGYEQGTFRTPGSDRPFAMFRPLGKDAPPPPTYFALAFD